MNLLYDHQVFSWQRYGGISRYFYELIARYSERSDVNVSLFLGFYLNEYGVENYRDALRHFWGMKRPALPKTTKAFTILNNALFHCVAPRYPADIYHQTYYANVAPGCKARRVVTVYDMIHELYPACFTPDDPTPNLKLAAVTGADGVICISQSTKNDLIKRYHVPEQKITVIYLGNSLVREVADSRLVDAPYILYVGQRDGYKNFHLILKAYGKSPRINKDFKLVCFGGDRFNKRERDAIALLNLSDRVLQLFGGDEVLANLYTFAAVFVYPSMYEGFGLPLLEAMHYGSPVLVSNSSSTPEVVGQAGLYFDPANLDDLMVNLNTILHDTALRERLKNAGREQGKRFSWDKCSNETIEFYRKVSA